MAGKETLLLIFTLVGATGGFLYITERAVGINILNMVPVFPLIKAK